jgi:ribosome-associated protein
METIRLDQFLKLVGSARTGGAAKALIQAGAVRVNRDVETRRARKLRAGDVVECEDGRWLLGEGGPERVG